MAGKVHKATWILFTVTHHLLLPMAKSEEPTTTEIRLTEGILREVNQTEAAFPSRPRPVRMLQKSADESVSTEEPSLLNARGRENLVQLEKEHRGKLLDILLTQLQEELELRQMLANKSMTAEEAAAIQNKTYFLDKDIRYMMDKLKSEKGEDVPDLEKQLQESQVPRELLSHRSRLQSPGPETAFTEDSLIPKPTTPFRQSQKLPTSTIASLLTSELDGMVEPSLSTIAEKLEGRGKKSTKRPSKYSTLGLEDDMRLERSDDSAIDALADEASLSPIFRSLAAASGVRADPEFSPSESKVKQPNTSKASGMQDSQEILHVASSPRVFPVKIVKRKNEATDSPTELDLLPEVADVDPDQAIQLLKSPTFQKQLLSEVSQQISLKRCKQRGTLSLEDSVVAVEIRNMLRGQKTTTTTIPPVTTTSSRSTDGDSEKSRQREGLKKRQGDGSSPAQVPSEDKMKKIAAKYAIRTNRDLPPDETNPNALPNVSSTPSSTVTQETLLRSATATFVNEIKTTSALNGTVTISTETSNQELLRKLEETEKEKIVEQILSEDDPEIMKIKEKLLPTPVSLLPVATDRSTTSDNLSVLDQIKLYKRQISRRKRGPSRKKRNTHRRRTKRSVPPASVTKKNQQEKVSIKLRESEKAPTKKVTKQPNAKMKRSDLVTRKTRAGFIADIMPAGESAALSGVTVLPTVETLLVELKHPEPPEKQQLLMLTLADELELVREQCQEQRVILDMLESALREGQTNPPFDLATLAEILARQQQLLQLKERHQQLRVVLSSTAGNSLAKGAQNKRDIATENEIRTFSHVRRRQQTMMMDVISRIANLGNKAIGLATPEGKELVRRIQESQNALLEFQHEKRFKAKLQKRLA